MGIYEIIKTVAERNGVSYEEVYESMKDAILEGFYNNDPDIQNAWKEISFTGNEPTPEELIEGIHLLLAPADRYKS